MSEVRSLAKPETQNHSESDWVYADNGRACWSRLAQALHKDQQEEPKTNMYISASPLLTEVSFPSPAGLERGGFGNEAGVREKHGAFTRLKSGL